MINSLKSTYSQLEKLDKYLNSKSENLFIATDTYSTLIDIRERLKIEIGQYESEKRRLNNPLIKYRKQQQRKYWEKKFKE